MPANNPQAARNLLGDHEAWGKLFPQYSWFMYVLAWFTVPVEVFLRRDFGERYYTRANFMAGLILLSITQLAIKLLSKVSEMRNFDASESRYNYSLSWILWLYLLVGVFHFGWLAYKEAVRRPVHSFSAGRSWLLPVGKFFLEVANDFLSFLIHGIIRFVPAHERATLLSSRPLLRDIRTFTERYIEPVVLLIAALIFAALGMAGIFGWLIFSMGALIIFTGIRHQTERNYILDIRDMKIEADYMRSLIAGEPQPYDDEPIQMRQVIQEVAHEAENSPETVEVLEQKQPTLADAIKAMNARRNKPPQAEPPQITDETPEAF